MKQQAENTIVAPHRKLEEAIATSWSAIAPWWPLSNLIAVNPLAGWENLEIEEALERGQAFFQQKELPKPMLAINRHSIKWLQAFYDEGQATIHLPFRESGLFQATRQLLPFDRSLSVDEEFKENWLQQLSTNPKKAIAQCLQFLEIPGTQHTIFLTLLLTTMPGWAAHIQYRCRQEKMNKKNPGIPDQQTEYLAFRLVLTCLLWPQAAKLLRWHAAAMERANSRPVITRMQQDEKDFQEKLLSGLSADIQTSPPAPAVQMAFCIDVRSEPFRRALEQQGCYETFGIAGFFGIPVTIHNQVSGEQYDSCPVLLEPSLRLSEQPVSNHDRCRRRHDRRNQVKSVYLSMKHSFSAPFALVETLGLVSGMWMAARTLFPRFMGVIRKSLSPGIAFKPSIQHISPEQQSEYAEGLLRMMGLTKNFAPLVVLCGHGSETQNNAFATSLDCGACGGHHGGPNARIMAAILNQKIVREILQQKGIDIPNSTHFLAAQHNTTTDEVTLFNVDAPRELAQPIAAFKKDLEKARIQNNYWRMTAANAVCAPENLTRQTVVRATDWAQVRPEWGLARNAAFIVGHRSVTRNVNLEGRCFLHSYDWKQDPDGTILTTILTAPMVVAQWINSQYLFSTLDNVAFGSGSKITCNITGKMGVMQGNASDLMHGLPLQSVYETDHNAYHQPIRLLTVVYAPRKRISNIIRQHEILRTLFGNGWVNLVCHDTETREFVSLKRDLSWHPWQWNNSITQDVKQATKVQMETCS